MTRTPKLTLAIAMAAAVLTSAAQAQVLLAPGPAATYTQNFDSLPSAPTATNVTVTGGAPFNAELPAVVGPPASAGLSNWYSHRSGSGPNQNLLAGNGSSNTGALYSFGTAASTDRALGAVSSGTNAGISYGLRLRNNSTFPILSLNVSYTGEQWRDAGAATPVAQTISFFYTVSNTALTSPIPTPPTSTTYPTPTGYTAVTALDMVTPTFTNTGAGTALDGNNATNRALIFSTINFVPSVQPGEEIFLLWGEPNHAGNDHGMAVDDFTVVAQFDTTLAVDLTSLSASAGYAGAPVTISWSTAAEFDNAGFRVKNVATGDVIGGFVPAEGSTAVGADYSVVDSTPLAAGETRTYVLEDIDLSGTTTVHGPVTASITGGASSVENWNMY